MASIYKLEPAGKDIELPTVAAGCPCFKTADRSGYGSYGWCRHQDHFCHEDAEVCAYIIEAIQEGLLDPETGEWR